MRIMLAQVAPYVGDIHRNKGLVVDAMCRAEAAGCDIVALPELTITGYPPEDLLFRGSFLAAVEQAVAEVVAKSGETTVIFGHPRREGGRLYNAATLARRGKVVGVYDKRALPNYGVFDERRYFTPGSSGDVFTVGGWRIGLGICEDLWDDAVAEASTGVARDVLINLNASPFHANKQQEREALMRRRARQFAVPVAYVNQVGGQDEVVFDGGTHLMDADGDLVARAPLFKPADVVVDVADLAVAEIAPLPQEIAQIYEALVVGVRDYVLRNGCRQVVLGLSGGIDSAVTAAIAAAALGAENVLGVLMPSPFSSEHSIKDAEALAQNLGIATLTLPIAEPVKAVEALLAEPFAAWGLAKPGVAEENIQARIRGLLLMAISNKTGRMLLSTGNKSEMAVGYTTLYGDMAGGFAVLKDVYKMQVYELASYINRERELIPAHTISKPPSAELRPGQLDTDTLPPYEQLDAMLVAYIEERLSVDEIAARGFDRDEVRRIVGMVHAAEYKRRQAPPGVKITQLAFGRDRRCPITHGFRE